LTPTAATPAQAGIDAIGREIILALQARAERLEALSVDEVNGIIDTAHAELATCLMRLEVEQETAERRAEEIETMLQHHDLMAVMRDFIAEDRYGRKGG
jgi:hypothetical protein